MSLGLSLCNFCVAMLGPVRLKDNPCKGTQYESAR